MRRALKETVKPKAIVPGLIFHDLQSHTRQSSLRGRHLLVTDVVSKKPGYCICQTVETGQTNTEIRFGTLLDEAKFRFIGVDPRYFKLSAKAATNR